MKENATPPRRQFLKQLTTTPLLALTLPSIGNALTLPEVVSPYQNPDENYWEGVKKQFVVPGNKVMMNAANLCPSPRAVSVRVEELATGLNKDVSFQFRSLFAELRKKSLGLLAEFVGADVEEIGITRNTSESNCLVVHGLDLAKEDEVIIWDQNHPSNEAVWLNRARRFGFTVKKISVPAAPSSVNELLEPFEKAITPKTKLIAFSHISNVSGIALPAKDICQMARARGILTLVDGAQSFGFLDLNLHDMGCSFFTASTHKWLMGPIENGLLYVRKEFIPKVWPNIIGGGWKESKTVDENCCVLGQRIESSTGALPEIIQFHRTIGKKIIQDRVVALNSYLKEQISKQIPKATFITPLSPALSGGIVIVNLPGKDPREVYQKLYESFGIATAPSNGIRFSPHIYNTVKDIDYAVKALVKLRS
jgi:isopenicillin-N epimerase